jgi:hypothetical protein
MVVCDRDIGGALCGPAEDNAPLVVDPDRVPAGCPALEWFKSVSLWHGKVLHLFSRIHRDQLAQGDSGNPGKTAVGLLPEEFLRVVVAEGNNHALPGILGTSSAGGRRN